MSALGRDTFGRPAESGSNRPLSLIEKFRVLVYNCSFEAKLSASEIKVFVFLVCRQNPSTARCDPSVRRLMSDTGLSERSVRGALSSLAKKGKIKRSRESSWSRNQIRITPVQKPVLDAVLKRPLVYPLQDLANEPAGSCRESVHFSAPRKGKGKQKEKDALTSAASANSRCRDGTGTATCAEDKTEPLRDQQEFERAAVSYASKAGFSYEDLVEMNSEDYDRIYRDYRSGRCGLGEALKELVDRLASEQL